MAPPLLQLRDIKLTFGGTPLLAGAELSVSPRDRICLVGRNGSGKSTLLKIAAGLAEKDTGSVFVQPGAKLAYLTQEPDFGAAATVRDYIAGGVAPGESEHEVDILIEDLGLKPDQNPNELSGGEARRAALSRIIVSAPDIMLLDEPTNHLDLPTIEWLEKQLEETRAAIVLISHDRRFLSNMTRATVWLDRGVTRRIDRGFADFEDWRDKLLEEEETAQHKLDRKIVAEEHWLRHGVSGRRKRNVKRLANLQALREDRRTHRKVEGTAAMAAAESGQSGALVIEAKGIAKSFGARSVVKDFSTRVLRGDRLGIVGPNGSGKTTLVKMLIGALSPDDGSVRLGTNLSVASLDQHRDSLAPTTTVADALTGGGNDTVMVGDQPRHVIGYMKDFLFAPEQARTPLGKLSGGERARVMLAQVMARPSNLLVLDEPTNDLDMETLDVLEEMIGDYTGTVLLISHDRDFLDRLAGSVIAPDGDGHWTEYAGGYTDMLAQRGEAKPGIPVKAAVKPSANVASSIAAAKPSGAKRKMTFSDKHALETLPKTIAKLEADARVLQQKLEDPNFFARDRAAFEQASKSLGEIQSKLTEAENRWLELEILREELG
jgi:ATP-binding cassette subfamily F protein uup